MVLINIIKKGRVCGSNYRICRSISDNSKASQPQGDDSHSQFKGDDLHSQSQGGDLHSQSQGGDLHSQSRAT